MRLNQDITLLMERKRIYGSEFERLYLGFYNSVSINKRAKKSINNDTRKCISSFEVINENTIKLNPKLFGKKIAIERVQGASKDANSMQEYEFQQTMNNILSVIGDSRAIVVVGKPNGRKGRRNGRGRKGPLGEEAVNDNRGLCELLSLNVERDFIKHSQGTPKLKKYIITLLCNGSET